MDDKQKLLRHFLAALAYRTQKHNYRTGSGSDLADSHCSTNRFATTQLIMPRHIVESDASARSLLSLFCS